VNIGGATTMYPADEKPASCVVFMRVISKCAHHSRLMSYPEPDSSFDRLMEHVIHRWRGQ